MVLMFFDPDPGGHGEVPGEVLLRMSLLKSLFCSLNARNF
jgi:hypothetical protein